MGSSWKVTAAPGVDWWKTSIWKRRAMACRFSAASFQISNRNSKVEAEVREGWLGHICGNRRVSEVNSVSVGFYAADKAGELMVMIVHLQSIHHSDGEGFPYMLRY